jgi:hypothetical protein
LPATSPTAATAARTTTHQAASPSPPPSLCSLATRPPPRRSSSKLAAEPGAAWLLPFIHALQAITAGSRDRSLADAPELDYSMAAEILFLIETLDKAAR